MSPLVPYADIAIFARSTPIDFVGSLVAPAILLQCIACETALQLGDAALERLEAAEATATDLGLFARDPAGPIDSANTVDRYGAS